MLNNIDLEEIRAYFQIDRRIKRLEDSILELRERFYEKTMTTRIESDGLKIYTVGERMDHIVVDYVDIILEKRKSIEILKKRQRYLNDYLNSLSPGDREYLKNKYTCRRFSKEMNELDIQLYEEIQEINEAINFMNGYPPDIRSVEVNNDNLENEFENILEALEV